MFSKRGMKDWFKRSISIDEILLYLAKGCKVHPLLYDHMFDQLEDMQRRGKLCLTPSSVFSLYHRNLRRKLKKAA